MRISQTITHCSLFTTAVLASIGAPRAAHAFAEDLCYAADGSLINCGPLPAACEPAGTITVACKLAIVALGAQQTQLDRARSSVHTDVTYVLAQAVGFSSTDAYWIAAYDEATDLGSFEPRDNHAVAVGGGALRTADITGVTRTNAMTGGVLLHLIAPYNHGAATPLAGVDGLRPDPTDAQTEPTLANFRAWALAASSADRPACTAGLTVPSPTGDLATGAACSGATPINAAVALVGPVAVPVATQTGPQIVQSTAAPIYAPAFDALIATDGAADASAGHAAAARLGVYLHLLADRITHHVCTDQSVIAGPTAAGFRIDFTSPDCTQPLHFLRHAWETGVTFSVLRAQDRTSEAAISTVYDELVAFARTRGVLRAGAGTRATKAAYAVALTRALEQFDAAARVAAINAVGCAHGLAPFPGQPACSAAR